MAVATDSHRTSLFLGINPQDSATVILTNRGKHVNLANQHVHLFCFLSAYFLLFYLVPLFL